LSGDHDPAIAASARRCQQKFDEKFRAQRPRNALHDWARAAASATSTPLSFSSSPQPGWRVGGINVPVSYCDTNRACFLASAYPEDGITQACQLAFSSVRSRRDRPVLFGRAIGERRLKLCVQPVVGCRAQVVRLVACTYNRPPGGKPSRFSRLRSRPGTSVSAGVLSATVLVIAFAPPPESLLDYTTIMREVLVTCGVVYTHHATQRACVRD